MGSGPDGPPGDPWFDGAASIAAVETGSGFGTEIMPGMVASHAAIGGIACSKLPTAGDQVSSLREYESS